MNALPLILLIEDEENIRSFMKAILASNDYLPLEAGNAAEALLQISSRNPDLILLDLGLPDLDGMELLRRIRQKYSTPIIVVSARTFESEKVDALDAGADDYITKPFGTSELLARVRTALRHAAEKQSSLHSRHEGRFTCRDLVIDYDKRRVYVGGEDVHLTQNEYKIVAMLSQHAGKVLTYDSIIRAIWGINPSSDNKILRVNMANIRRKIEKSTAEPQYIFTEMGVGYRMAEEDA
ncbi:MAG: response regulator transcription factor [Clostridiales bacterium]|nr:response regulator transcription factor [Clostridiales bacterium]